MVKCNPCERSTVQARVAILLAKLFMVRGDMMCYLSFAVCFARCLNLDGALSGDVSLYRSRYLVRACDR
jgi:hypothetical protein